MMKSVCVLAAYTIYTLKLSSCWPGMYVCMYVCMYFMYVCNACMYYERM